MRRAGLVFILLGLVLAVLAGLALFVLYPRQPQAQVLPEPTTSLVFAFQNIPDRTEIGPSQVGKADWPQRIPTPIGAFANPDDVVGKLAVVPISPGQPVVSTMLLDKNQAKETHSNASLILEPGTVAVAIPVNTLSNVAEAVQPGDRVDLLATFSLTPITDTKEVSPTKAASVIVSQRLLQDLLVLQVGTWPHVTAPQPSSAAGPLGTTSQTSAATQSNPAPVVVTLQVNEEDALVLKYAQTNATDFSFALRPANDHLLANPTPVTIDYLQQRFGFQFPDVGR